MDKFEQSFRNLFPPGRVDWVFTRRQPIRSWSCDELAVVGTASEEAIKIPDELVERIYRQGWEDAITAAKQALSEVRG